MIEKAKVQDVPAAADMLADAFNTDQNMIYFFGGGLVERRFLVCEFFNILMSARLALNAPVFLAKLKGQIEGVVMGNNTTRPDWLPEQAAQWSRFEKKQEGLVDRLNRQEEIVNSFKPKRSHYYIGVLGVRPSCQGKGIGAALINRFCATSDADTASSGTYIETANPLNAKYYQRFGFEPSGDANLDPATRLWTLFRPTP